MKYIKDGIIYEPHNEFVEAQMIKNGYIPYDKVIEATDVKVEEVTVEVVEEPKTEEKPKKKKK